jgi:predicted AlkP superfamily pyrophosphatase or phosphodiesterase
MPDLTAQLTTLLRQTQLPGFEADSDRVYPAYDGASILNLPATICRWLGASELGAGPLQADLTAPIGGGIRRVILVLVDALSLSRLQRWMADGMAGVWSSLGQEGLLAPLTSITPSTTSAALTTLWTGASAAVHGITGYEMWLKEYGVVANTILHAPITFQNDAGSLAKAGFSAEKFLPPPTLGSHLSAQGIPVYAFQHQSLLRSGLSQMFFADVTTRGFFSAADLWVSLRQLLEGRPGERLYAWVYWSELDTLGHRFGPDDERVAAEFANFSVAFERQFLSRLSPAARRGTLLVLTADHGQIATAQDPYYELKNHPGLSRRLHINPTGENRLIYLYVRPGQSEAVREYIERAWPNQYSLVNAVYAVENGLFGPGEPHPRLLERLGDFILIPRGNAYLWWSEKENILAGRHGGLHPDEMLVPFLAVRL